MGYENKELVAQRSGQVVLADDLFTPDQQRVMGSVLTICDHNPILQWRKDDPNHNLDFCLIEGKIEPVKGFCLKCIHVAGFSVESESTPMATAVKLRNGNDDTLISVSITIFSHGGPRFTMWGASSIRECDQGGTNKRALHDALARAQTRALKSAVEAAVGMPFINAILEKLFGGFEVTGSPAEEGAGARNVTGTGDDPIPAKKENPESRKIWQRIWALIHSAYDSGLVKESEQDEIIQTVKINMERPNILLDLETFWIREIADRNKAAR